VPVGSPSGDEPQQQLSLADVIREIARLDPDLTVYVPSGEPVEPTTRVVLVDEEAEEQPDEGMTYLLEVHLMRDVLRVWKTWRGGREPTSSEACGAIAYYAKHVAYQPVSS
jgi:hypothetical protein